MHGLLLTVALLAGHPPAKDSHDRVIVVRLTPEAVVVDYRLELDKDTSAKELPREELGRIFSPKEVYPAISRFLAKEIPENLRVELDGAPLSLKCTRSKHQAVEHLRCEYRFEAPWSPTPDQTHRFSFRENNWTDDSCCKIDLSLTGVGRLSLLNGDVPSPLLIARPPLDRRPGDAERLRKASAAFQLIQAPSRGAYKPALPPDLVLPPWPEHPEDGAEGKPASAESVAENKPAGARPERAGQSRPAEAPSATEDTTRAGSPEMEGPLPTDLREMLDSKLGLGVLLVLAALFGAAHALTPGHGKTLVAAYLVGERGTVGQAFLLGLVTTFTHTFAVIVLAILFRFTDCSEAVKQALPLAGGILVACFGLWLLLCRLTGQADHIHIGGGHHHHHGHGHDHEHVHLPVPRDGKPVTGWGLIVLGMHGGMVPCWDAILVLVFAISSGRLWLGLPLVLAFSAGLAGVLIALGIGVVYARNLAESRWGSSRNFEKVVRVLPLLSAVLLTVMGLWLSYASIHGTHH